jgi:hypothetical protein
MENLAVMDPSPTVMTMEVDVPTQMRYPMVMIKEMMTIMKKLTMMEAIMEMKMSLINLQETKNGLILSSKTN